MLCRIGRSFRTMVDAFKDMLKWVAVNWGAKYPIISTLLMMMLAAFLWNVFVRSVTSGESTPTAATSAQAPHQSANDSDCSNTSITAGGSVTNNCTASSPPNADHKK